jgi:anti-anti-sigma regulatory factor
MAVLEIVAGQTKAVILLMDEVHAMDATGLVALESALEPLRKHKCLAILSNVRAQPMRLLKKAQLDQHEGVVFCSSTTEALATAARHVAATPTLAPPSPTAAAQSQAR